MELLRTYFRQVHNIDISFSIFNHQDWSRLMSLTRHLLSRKITSCHLSHIWLTLTKLCSSDFTNATLLNLMALLLVALYHLVLPHLFLSKITASTYFFSYLIIKETFPIKCLEQPISIYQIFSLLLCFYIKLRRHWYPFFFVSICVKNLEYPNLFCFQSWWHISMKVWVLKTYENNMTYTMIVITFEVSHFKASALANRFSFVITL